MFTLIWAVCSLLGLIYLLWMTYRSGFKQNSIKQAAKTVKTQNKVLEAYESINSEPAAPKPELVKRLRRLAPAYEPLPDVSQTEPKRGK